MPAAPAIAWLIRRAPCEPPVTSSVGRSGLRPKLLRPSDVDRSNCTVTDSLEELCVYLPALTPAAPNWPDSPCEPPLETVTGNRLGETRSIISPLCEPFSADTPAVATPA